MTDTNNLDKTEQAALGQGLEKKEGAVKPPEKTAEELSNLVKEYESKLGMQGQEVGELKKQLLYLQEEQRRRDFELSQRRQRIEQSPAQPEPEESDDFDWTRPGKSTAEIARRETQKEFEKREKARREYDVRMYQEYAHKRYETGWRKAREKNAAVFDGIENAVQDLIYQSFAQGKLNADELEDERIWEKTAQLIWLDKGNYEKIVPSKERREGMRPPTGENLPDQVKAGMKVETPINFDEKSKEIMKALNLTEEQAKQNIEAERESRKE